MLDDGLDLNYNGNITKATLTKDNIQNSFSAVYEAKNVWIIVVSYLRLLMMQLLKNASIINGS